MTTLLLIFCAFMIYCIPGIVAEWRHHNNTKAINTLNLLLGWTLLGWIVALVWALTDNVKPSVA